MKEDKQSILNSLCTTLQKTRMFNDLINIEYLNGKGMEYAVLYFKNEKKYINITANSGYAIILDIIEQIKRR